MRYNKTRRRNEKYVPQRGNIIKTSVKRWKIYVGKERKNFYLKETVEEFNSNHTAYFVKIKEENVLTQIINI